MALSKAVLTAFKTASRLKADIRKSYKVQRVMEDVAAGVGLPNLRCATQDITAHVADGAEIPLRVFTPRDIDFSLRDGLQVSEDFRGTILFFHGGGWVNGDVDFYSDVCARTAVMLERRVVAVDYRRAPEYRFPTAPEDCYAVTRQLLAGELLEDVNPDHVTLFGDSAGGNLAAVVSLMARDRGEFEPRPQMLLYPLVYNDHSPTSRFDSVRENGQDYLLTAEEIEGYIDLYAPNPADRTNPYFAPLLAHDLAYQPRTLVMSAEYCPLRDEGEQYARRLAQAGCDVTCYRVRDAVHGYFLYPSVLEIVQDTYRIMRHFLDGEELVREDGGDASWLEIPGIDSTM